MFSADFIKGLEGFRALGIKRINAGVVLYNGEQRFRFRDVRRGDVHRGALISVPWGRRCRFQQQLPLIFGSSEYYAIMDKDYKDRYSSFTEVFQVLNEAKQGWGKPNSLKEEGRVGVTALNSVVMRSSFR